MSTSVSFLNPKIFYLAPRLSESAHPGLLRAVHFRENAGSTPVEIRVSSLFPLSDAVHDGVEPAFEAISEPPAVTRICSSRFFRCILVSQFLSFWFKWLRMEAFLRGLWDIPCGPEDLIWFETDAVHDVREILNYVECKEAPPNVIVFLLPEFPSSYSWIRTLNARIQSSPVRSKITVYVPDHNSMIRLQELGFYAAEILPDEMRKLIK